MVYCKASNIANGITYESGKLYNVPRQQEIFMIKIVRELELKLHVTLLSGCVDI